MSTTIGDLVNRVYREYLEAPDDLESYSYLTGGINSTATTLAYDDNLFSSEEEDALGAGTVIEINKELILPHTPHVFEIWAKQGTALAEALYLICWGDWLSYYLSELNKVDIMDIKAIDYLKSELSKL